MQKAEWAETTRCGLSSNEVARHVQSAPKTNIRSCILATAMLRFPGRHLRKGVFAMDAQTVLALCAVLMLVLDIIGFADTRK